MFEIALLLTAGLWAGTQNALAGGGSFITLPALIAVGLDPKLANITSTMALFPGQITTGMAGRSLVAGTGRVPFRTLVAASLVGGIAGAFLLIATPTAVFAGLVPWLVLAATLLFAWSSFGPRRTSVREPAPAWATVLGQLLIGVYGGFFGGGAGIIMMASLALAGMPVRNAGATKNVLASLHNLVAALVFAFSGAVAWSQALILGVAAMAGGYIGARALKVLPERVIKTGVIVIGVALTVGLFVRR
jgi:uncharacterized membrane protein YfcA